MEERFLPAPENQKYYKFSEEWMSQGFTPIFEWCSPRNKIVLHYDTDFLVLTGIRNNRTGNYVKHSTVVESATNHSIPLTESHIGTVHSLTEFMNDTQAKELIEGVVIRFEDGSMYKIKTNWYFDRTKKDKQDYSLNSERNIWKYILDQEIDDALANMNDSHLSAKVKTFEVLLYDTISAKATHFAGIANSVRSQNALKKDFVKAIISRSDIPKESHDLLFKIFDQPEKEPLDLLLAMAKRCCGNQGTLESFRVVLGGIKFSE